MNLKPTLILAAALPLVGATTASAPVRVLDEMAGVIAPQAQVLWDVTNGAQDDNGTLVAAKIKPADWVRLRLAGERMTASLERLQHGQPITIRAAGQQTMDEKTTPGGLTAAQIQAHIDANPAGFRAMALGFTEITRSISKAAAAHDGKAIGRIADDLDQACEGCHQAYWYPELSK